MGRQFRPEEAEESRGRLRKRLNEYAKTARGIVSGLESIAYDRPPWHNNTWYPGVAVYLHDEIATAEELERLIRDIEIHELTEEELEDGG